MLYNCSKTQTLKQLPGLALVKETISSPDGSHIAVEIMRQISKHTDVGERYGKDGWRCNFPNGDGDDAGAKLSEALII